MTASTGARDDEAALTLLYDAYARLSPAGAWTTLRDAASDRDPRAGLALPFWSQIAVAWSLPGAIAEGAHQAGLARPAREAVPADYPVVRRALLWTARELGRGEPRHWRPDVAAPVIAWECEAGRSQAQVLTLIERAIQRAGRELAQQGAREGRTG